MDSTTDEQPVVRSCGLCGGTQRIHRHYAGMFICDRCWAAAAKTERALRERAKLVRSSAMVGEVEAALTLLERLGWSVCDMMSEQEWKTYQDAEQHLRNALASERHPSPTAEPSDKAPRH